jgi:hypothetical protein
MTWTVAWSFLCDEDVKRLHWLDAERICRAVGEYARSGSGRLEAMSGPSRYRLRVAGAVALLRLDEKTATVHVDRLYGTR